MSVRKPVFEMLGNFSVKYDGIGLIEFAELFWTLLAA